MVSRFGYPSFKQFDLDPAHQVSSTWLLRAVVLRADRHRSTHDAAVDVRHLRACRRRCCGRGRRLRRAVRGRADGRGPSRALHPQRRLQYLEAIGIDLWVSRRDSGASAGLPAARPSAAASERDLPPPGETAARWEALRSEVLPVHAVARLHLTRHPRGRRLWGPSAPDWLVIGEAPGAEEDRRGEPFVGGGRPAAGCHAAPPSVWIAGPNVYIANVLKRAVPRETATPRARGSGGRALPYLVRQIALLQPKIMPPRSGADRRAEPARHQTCRSAGCGARCIVSVS